MTVKVDVMSDSTVLASGTGVYSITPGNHVAIPCIFEVPPVGGARMDLVLSTSKGGVRKFSEARRFNIVGTFTGTGSNVVTLGEPGSAVNGKTVVRKRMPVPAGIRLACLGLYRNRSHEFPVVNSDECCSVLITLSGRVVERVSATGSGVADPC